MTAHLNKFLDTFLQDQQAARRAAVAVTAEPDAKIPGRTIYRLEGAAKGLVQSRMGELCGQAADEGAFANFVGPYRTRDCTYVAHGEVVMPQTQAVA